MAERELVINKARVEYDGLINLQAVLDLFREFQKDKQYNYIERAHSESVRKDGKFVKMEVTLFKKITDYAVSEIAVKAQFSELKDRVVEIDGRKTKLYEGKAQVVFDGVLKTDYESRWETKPGYYFLRAVFERYVYTPYISGFREKVADDTNFLINNVKSVLNLQARYG